jgi:DNA-binding MarR family transcriptional regulator
VSAIEPDYARLLRFRKALRAFLRWSDEQARELGLTPSQHQLLLCVRGHAEGAPTVGDIAADLMLRHHSAVELVNRAEAAGLVSRSQDPVDRRVIRVRVTSRGDHVLRELSSNHLREIRRLAPVIDALATE